MEFESFALTLGLEWKVMLVFVALTIAGTEVIKGFKVKGKWLFLPGILIPFFLNLAWFSQPEGFVDWKLLIFGTILVSIVAMGGNAKIKNWAHKLGRSSSKELDQEKVK